MGFDSAFEGLILIARQRDVIGCHFFFRGRRFVCHAAISGAKGGVHGDYLHPLLKKSWLGYDFFIFDKKFAV